MMHQSQLKEIPSSFNLFILRSSGSTMAAKKSNETLYQETHKLTVSTSNGSTVLRNNKPIIQIDIQRIDKP